MIGDRIKIKRLASGLSLQDLADSLKKSGHKISRATLSNYETGKIVPNDQILESIAMELGTSPDFFTYTDIPDITIDFLRETGLVPKREHELISYVQLELEKYSKIESLLGIVPDASNSNHLFHKYNSTDSIEQITENIRLTCGIGNMPIASVCNTLELNGWYAIPIPDDFEIDCISGVIKPNNIPFIVFRATISPIDRLRYILLQQVSYYYISGINDKNSQEISELFAGSLLLPKSKALSEFGDKRSEIFPAELAILKRKYGIARRDIMQRLNYLNIISSSTYNRFISFIKQHGFPRRQDVMGEILYFYENPTKLDKIVLRAQAENLISDDVAENFISI